MSVGHNGINTIRDGKAEWTPEVEAHPTEQRWRVEIHDGGQWMPAGLLHASRESAMKALKARRAAVTSWAADGEPVRWRVVRETTTWTVEDES